MSEFPFNEQWTSGAWTDTAPVNDDLTPARPPAATRPPAPANPQFVAPPMPAAAAPAFDQAPTYAPQPAQFFQGEVAAPWQHEPAPAVAPAPMPQAPPAPAQHADLNHYLNAAPPAPVPTAEPMHTYEPMPTADFAAHHNAAPAPVYTPMPEPAPVADFSQFHASAPAPAYAPEPQAYAPQRVEYAPAPVAESAPAMTRHESMSRRERRRRGVPVWALVVSVIGGIVIFGGAIGAFAVTQQQHAASLEKQLAAERTSNDQLRSSCGEAMQATENLRIKAKAFDDVTVQLLQDIVKQDLEGVRADMKDLVQAEKDLKAAYEATGKSECSKLVGSGS